MSFSNPLVLVLLPIALAILLATLKPLRPAERRRRWFPIVVRGVLVSLLVVAAAGPKMVRPVDGRAVAIVVDVSKSIPDAVRSDVSTWLERIRADRRAEDAEEVILVGESAGVEVPYRLDPADPYLPADLGRPRSRVGRDATDLSAAIRLAVGSFPEGFARRIVLVTDGNENRGDAIAAARKAAADGVEIFALPVRYSRTGETAVARVDAPDSAVPGGVVTFSPILVSTEPDRPVLVRAFIDGEEFDRKEIVLPEGKSRGPEFRAIFDAPDVHELSVVVEAAGDLIPENNEASAGITIAGGGGVLVVEASGPDGPVLNSLLAQGIAAAPLPPARLPEDPYRYHPYDAVVLSNVGAIDLTQAQLEALEVAVRDLGTGLVVLGGENAYGPGGYGGTALERCLPIRMEIREKQVLLNGAMAMILHTCEFEGGDYWSVQIAKESILALSPADYAGILVFDYMQGDSWALPLGPVSDRAAVMKQLDLLAPGDMPAFDPTLRMAVEALSTCPAYLRHIVVISDGDAAPPDLDFLKKAVEEHRISISSICIGPHQGSDQQLMKDLAAIGKGRYYFLDGSEAEQLPKIFIREATTLRRSAIRREPFVPRFTVAPEDLPPSLAGFGGALPALGIFALTEGKERAEVPIVNPDGDPVLAFWRYGLGEAVAFTSGFQAGWLGEWESWPELDRLLAQVVRGAFREAPRAGFAVESETSAGVATVRVTALTDEGEELDFLRISGSASRPGEAPRAFALLAKGGGTYEGSFPVDGESGWIAVMKVERPDGEVTYATTPVATPYPEEFADLATDDAFFARLEDEAGARILEAADPVFAGATVEGEAEQSLVPPLLLAAAILLPFDVFVRRTGFDPAMLFAALARRRNARRAAAAARKPAPKARAGVPVGAGRPAGGEDVPDASERAAGPSQVDRPPPPAEKPSRGKGAAEEGAGGMRDLLAAKKRATRKRRWEETGHGKGAEEDE